MSIRAVGTKLNEYLCGNKYIKPFMTVAAWLLLVPVILQLINTVLNMDMVLRLNRFSADTSILNALSLIASHGILPTEFTTVNKLIGCFGLVLTFAKARYKALGLGFALLSLSYLLDVVPYWMAGYLFPVLSAVYIVYIAAFAYLSFISYREARSGAAE